MIVAVALSPFLNFFSFFSHVKPVQVCILFSAVEIVEEHPSCFCPAFCANIVYYKKSDCRINPG